MNGIKLAKMTLENLSDTQDEVDGVIDTMPVDQLVSLGQRLWWIVKRANKTLDLIKKRLRDEATLFPDKGTVTHRFEAPNDGTHSLVIPSSPQLTINKTTDVEKLKATLGPRFDDFFTTTVRYQPCKDFQLAIKSASPAEQAVLLDAVNVNSRTARVVFKD